ncbi:trypsin-like serine protease [Myxococcota bacterium]|nr:trypsin-like serine protease [Myxococcota bacterium]
MPWTRALAPLIAAALPGAAHAAPPAEDPPVAGVVGGQVVNDNRWPDTAAVYFGNQPGCTGVLVAPDVVLTAGHCAGGISKVKLGVDDYTEPGESIDVAVTEEYPNSWSTYDVSLLILESPSSVAPRAIARSCILDRYLADGAEVAIVGYGATNQNGTQYDSKLREAITAIDDADCDDLSQGCNRNVSPGGELTAGGDGVDSCFGDSGGPLYLMTKEGPFLVGITSRAVNGSSHPCGDGGIYARPDAIVDWIEETSGRILEEPDCDPNGAPVPSAEPISVREGDTSSSQVHPNDPDAGDTHTYAVENAPALGEATVDAAGLVVYTAAEDVEGEDEVRVRVTDDGVPPASSVVTVSVEVLPAESPSDDDAAGDDDAADDDDDDDVGDGGGRSARGCSCDGATSGGPGAGAALGLVAFAWAGRRRGGR